jgi:dCTP deaminase
MKVRKIYGAIPDFGLKRLIDVGMLAGVKQQHINPASINLPISEEMWRVEKFFLPRNGETISSLIKGDFCGRPHSYSHPLERHVTYLVKLKPEFTLPEDIYGFCNPRSTTGRTFLKVHVVADGVGRYDSIPRGFKGELWLLVRNDIFSSLLAEDDELAQARLFFSDTRLDDVSMRKFYKKHPLLFDKEGKPIPYSKLAITDHDGSLVMTLEIKKGEHIGWVTKKTDRPVKFSKKNLASDFFDIAFSKDGTYELDPTKGLIIPTKEKVWVPNNMAAECVRVDDRAGEFNSHRAGYVDCGFRGAITLEVTGSHEIIRDGTSALKLKFERTTNPAQKPYASDYSNKVTAALGRNFV